MIRISIDESNLKMAENIFSNAPQVVHKAAAAAINRTVISLRKTASVTARKYYVVPASTVKKAIAIKRASGSSGKGAFIAKCTPLRLDTFSLRTPRRGPVRVKVQKAGGMKPTKNLFIHNSKGPLQRLSSASYPLRVPYGPSVPQMVGGEETLKELTPLADEILNKRFLHEIEYRYEKGNG